MFQRPDIFNHALKNRFFALRHGQSTANVAGIILSDPAVGTADYGLSETGQQQVAGSMVEQSVLGVGTRIYSSDFLRAIDTAAIAAEQISARRRMITTPLLRERYFGHWEGSDSANYHKVWRDDFDNASHTQQGVESVNAVAARASSLIEDIEAGTEGEVILLVSHGDTLQILECVFSDLPLTRHRDLQALETAELRRLG